MNQAPRWVEHLNSCSLVIWCSSAFHGVLSGEGRTLAALAEDAKALDQELDAELDSDRTRIGNAITAIKSKASVLTDKLAQGVLDDALYEEKTVEHQAERQRFERQLIALGQRSDSTYALVRALADAAASLYINFDSADEDGKREVLTMVIFEPHGSRRS